MLRLYRYARYKDQLDISRQDLLSLSGKPKSAARPHLPMIRETSVMSRRLGFVRSLRAENGEVADEMHEFENVRQGAFRLNRLLVRKGRVIELSYRW